jgi:hypothetical protein
MSWLSKLFEFTPKVNIEAGGKRSEIVHIFRIEPQDLKICIPKVFTKHRRFPFSDEFHSFHAFSDGRIEWEKH